MVETTYWKNTIVELLKEELEITDEANNYNQWVLGVSVREDFSKTRVLENPYYTVRVVVKTSDSPYVDGMDISFWIQNGEVQMDPEYFENGPDFQGGTVTGAISWLEQLANIYYLQVANPHQVDLYLTRLENAIKTYSFTNLMEYTLDSNIGRDLQSLYQDLIVTTLQEPVAIEAKEVSDGKYELQVTIRGDVYTFTSKAWYMVIDVLDELEEHVLLPLLEKSIKEVDSNVD